MTIIIIVIIIITIVIVIIFIIVVVTILTIVMTIVIIVIIITASGLLQGEVAMLRRQVGESEGEVQVLLGQLAVQSKLAVSSSKELTQLHDLICKHENQIRLVRNAAVNSCCQRWAAHQIVIKQGAHAAA